MKTKASGSFFGFALCIVIMIGLSLTVAGRRGSSTSGKSAPPPSHVPGPTATGSMLTTAEATAQPQVAAAYGKLPLSFEANQGQTDPHVKFLSRGLGYSLFLTSTEAILTLDQTASKPVTSAAFGRSQASGRVKPAHPEQNVTLQRQAAIRMSLVGANPAASMAGHDELPGKANYFLGNDPRKWHTNVPTYGRVEYDNLYHGVDLIYYGNQRNLETDFVVAAGTNLGPIRLKFQGAKSININRNGDLVLKIRGGETLFRKPVAYQGSLSGRVPLSDPGRHFVSAHYVLKGQREVGFEVGEYDASKPLIIDPVLTYSTYLAGSNGGDIGQGIAVDAAGNAYVTGETFSIDFPTVNPFQSACAGTGTTCQDAFVAKLNPAGTALIYSTYLGGSSIDLGEGIAVDAAGNAYVAGQTFSTDFPTMNPFQSACTGVGGCGDAFVTKLNPAGDALIYSTYFGGSHVDGANAIAVDTSGNAYVTGLTQSADFPTMNPFQKTCFQLSPSFCSTAFVTKFNPTGDALVYSTYLGGSGCDAAGDCGGESGLSIAVDATGNAYVTGQAGSLNFPLANPFQSTCAVCPGSPDAFVTKFNATGTALVYSTYLGGSVGLDGAGQVGRGIAVDATGNAYVTGFTNATDFPTANAFQATLPDAVGSAFVTKFNPAGNTLVYSTYLGGTGGSGFGSGIAVDSAGNTYVTGGTVSADFPLVSPIRNTCSACKTGNGDVFVTKFNASGDSLVYSTYLGGYSPAQNANGIAVDSAGDVYVVVGGLSSPFPITPGAFQMGATGGPVIAKISNADAPGFAAAPASVNFLNLAVNTNLTQNMTLYDVGSQPLAITSMNITGTDAADFSDTTTCPTSSTTVAAATNCVVSVTFSPKTLGTKVANLVVSDDAAGSPHTIPLTGISLTALPLTFSPSSLSFGTQAVGTYSAPQNITLTNTTNAPISITGFGLVKGLDFGLGGTTCGSTMNSGTSCTFGIVFTPTSTGLKADTLSIQDNAPQILNTVALSGTAVPLDFSISANPASASVTAGGAATFALSVSPAVAPQFSFPAVGLACSGAPAASTCSVAPNSVTMDSANPKTATVTVTTTARSSSSAGMMRRTFPPDSRLWSALACIPAFACVFIGAPRRRRFGLRRRAWIGISAVLLLAVLSFACGGGSSSSGAQSGTPAGTFSITVTGSSGSLSHTVNLTLKVN